MSPCSVIIASCVYETGPQTVNAGFEQPNIGNAAWSPRHESTVPGWETDGNNDLIELWRGTPSGGLPGGGTPDGRGVFEGRQAAEINYIQAARLFQHLVLPSTAATLSWRWAHRARNGTGVNRAEMLLGPTVVNWTLHDVVSQSVKAANDTSWSEFKGTWAKPAGVTQVTVSLRSTAPGGAVGNIVDGVALATLRPASLILDCSTGEREWVDAMTGVPLTATELATLDCQRRLAPAPTAGVDPSQTQVPDIVGDDEATAQFEIGNANLNPVHNAGNDACDNVVAAGSVITQTPLAGSQVPIGSDVTYGLSLGPCPATVPDIVGDPEAQAQTKVADEGLNPVHNAAGDACDNVVPAGSVLTQDPAAGTEVASGSNVTYTLSTGDCPVVEPVIAELVYTNPLPAAQQAAFEAARDFWNSVLTTLLQPVNHDGDPAYDQILINVDVAPNDGPGGILGSAGPTMLRPDLTTLEGDMTFDSADIANLEAGGQLDEVVKHEMGHVLGIGTLWQIHGLDVDLGTADAGFTGAGAVAEYNAMVGAPGGADRVPVEWNTGNPGSDGGHWDTSPGHNDPGQCFDNELMSFALSGSAAVSRVTLASLTDLGYPGVDMAQADPFVCGQA